MSSSDSDVAPAKVAKKQDKNSKKAVKKADNASPEEYQIKPAKGGPSMDTSTWPLLLKVMSPNINIYKPTA